LRTLTVLQETSRLVEEKTGQGIDFDTMTFDDPNLFAMISRGETNAVFQLEGGGMTQFLRELQPESFEDIIAGISLFRPGPMEQIPRYVEARHDARKIHYDWPLLEPILKVTYGVIVYQEQVIRIVRDLAGFSLAQADNVRRAMGKKDEKLLQSYRTLFIEGGVDDKGFSVTGAMANGVPRKVAEKLFDDIYAFAGYAFNKAHAASYAAVAYNTAWCKYYYPIEYMVAILNSNLGDLGQAERYVRTAEEMGVSVLPPDINKSAARFAPEGQAIRFGLAAVKNVGKEAIGVLVSEREDHGPFSSFGDFIRRMCDTTLNRKMIESLVRSSACDGFHASRSAMVAVIEPFSDSILDAKKRVMDGQISFFGSQADDACLKIEEPDYPNVPEYPLLERLMMEKEMTGLYVTGHPLSTYKQALDSLPLVRSSELKPQDPVTEIDFADVTEGDEGEQPIRFRDRDRVVMAGLLTTRRDLYTKNNDRMAFISMEDAGGSWEVVVFPKVYAAFHHLMDDHSALIVAGSLDLRDEEPKLLAEAMAPLTADLRDLPDAIKQATARNRRNNRNHQGGRQTSPSKDTQASRYKEGGEGQVGGGKTQAPRAAAQASSGNDAHAIQSSKPEAIVIRIPAAAQDNYLESLKAALVFFEGDVPVRLYDEARGEFLSGADALRVEWTSENAILLMERFGADNFGVF
ncbi:MAG TPA: DNA polymerase III subunit alpha, partial [Clostridia bacterium]|nr:DNA polymerase III subunit alpha [Clostridia bacterium]